MMKYTSIAFILIISAIFSGCKDSASAPTNIPKSGTIILSISNALIFNNHSIYFGIWDSCDQITGAPAGVMQGVGFFEVHNGVGSALTMSPDGQTTNLFKPGTYYPFYIADMNNNFSMANQPDSGDYIGGGINHEIKVDGNIIKQLTMQDFSGPLQ